MTRLAKYIVEYKLFFWLLKQNCSKGVLPAPSNLMMQASEFIPGMIPDRIRSGLRKYFLNSESTTARHWMESFKERWGVEAAIAETGQDVDPDIGDFQVPWLSPVGPFFGFPWQFFFGFFSRKISILGPILGPIFGSVFGTQNWASEWGFNKILFMGPKVGPTFGSIFGTHFWAPFSHFFALFLEPWPVFFWCLELAVRLLHMHSGPNLLAPLVTRFPYSSIWMKPE